MKKIIIILFLLFPVQGFADGSKVYVSGSTGILFSNTIDTGNDNLTADLASGFSGSAAVGVDFHYWRIELEYGYKDIGINSFKYLGVEAGAQGNINVHSLMTNTYVDGGNGGDSKSWLSPYLGFGIGVAWQNIEVTNIKGVAVDLGEGNNAFAYQAMLGTTTKFTDSLSSDLGYRYFATNDVAAHGFQLKLRYSF